MNPQISTVSQTATFAGQTIFSVNVTYRGEATKTVMFMGMVGAEGGVVFMGAERVTDSGRFGPFGTQWVINFFS